MNKIFILLPLAVIMTFIGCKTSPKNTENSSEITKKIALYDQLNEIGDNYSCITLLQEVLQIDSTKTEYYDSLAFLYVKVKNGPAALKMSTEALKHGKNDKILELAAVLTEQNNEIEKATVMYNELFERTKNLKYKYQLAAMNIERGDWKLAEDILKELMKSESIHEETIEQDAGQSGSQMVPLDAAINIAHANIEAMHKQNLKGALNYTNKALKIMPDYQLALYFKQQLMGAGRR